MRSTVASTGHDGKRILSQPWRCIFCRLFRTATGISGRAK